MNLHVLQHIHCEGPGEIGNWARDRGWTISTTHLYLGESLPEAATVDLLLVVGGPMNVYPDREYPWLPDERSFIKSHIAAGKPAIGICLGAQFLADALGSRVIQNPHIEVGCFPVEFTAEARKRFPFLPASLPVIHWHGDTFELPGGALHLTTSAVCRNQGFLYDGRVLALQFHPEVTCDDLEEWMREFDNEPAPSASVQEPRVILETPTETFAAGHAMLRELLDAVFPNR